MRTRSKFSLVLAAAGLVSLVVLIAGGMGYNEASNWQFVQYPLGSTEIRDKPGWYLKWFANVTTYPRETDVAFGDGINPTTGERYRFGEVRTSFSDNGEGHNSGYARFTTIGDGGGEGAEDIRKALHKKYRGIEGVKSAEMNYTIRTLKVTGPTMTASEHKQARKAEFLQQVDAQLSDGNYIYTQEQIADPSGIMEEIDLLDENGRAVLGDDGNPIKVMRPVMITANKVVTNDDGSPRVAEAPPFTEYGIAVTQFEIVKTDYDTQSIALFAARQQALLNAQKFKAEQDQARQEAGKVREEKLMELAEAEGNANIIKAKAVIAAQQKAEVAEQLEEEARNLAEKAKVEAQMRLDVADLDLQAADKNAQAIERLASAEEERIQKAGAITEHDRILAEIERDRDIQVAQHMANVRTPGVVFVGGNNEGGGSNYMEQLVNLWLLKSTGIIPTPQQSAPVTQGGGE